MIPKIIHYCWLGDSEFPELVKKCIQSWKKKMPDWEFILWDKNCLKDLNSDWVNEAYSTKKYAFAADYIRLYAVNKFGGFYLDSDVEVLKNFAPLLDSPYIFALENEIGDIEAATFGSEPNNPYVQKCLSYYEGRHFIQEDGSWYTKEIAPDVLALAAEKFGLKYDNEIEQQLEERMLILPSRILGAAWKQVTDDTIAVHLSKGSWRKRTWLRNILTKLNFYRKIFKAHK